MKYFENLYTLSLTGGSITTIPALNTIPSLQLLFLNNNKINQISPTAFAELPIIEVNQYS